MESVEMAIKTIEKLIINDGGLTGPITCPSCKETVNMHVFEHTDYSFLALVLGKDKDGHFAVCPKCAKTFSISENYMKEYLSGTSVIMTEGDLTEIKKGDKNA